MTQSEAVSHWKKRAEAELKAARALFEGQDRDLYGEVIFHCHLAVELAFKAEYIQKHDAAAPFTHNLGELASAVGGAWTDSDRDDFDRLSDAAILARYGDEAWFSRNATRENAALWLEKAQKFLSRF